MSNFFIARPPMALIPGHGVLEGGLFVGQGLDSVRHRSWGNTSGFLLVLT
jgi:hypothetical protein